MSVATARPAAPDPFDLGILAASELPPPGTESLRKAAALLAPEMGRQETAAAQGDTAAA